MKASMGLDVVVDPWRRVVDTYARVHPRRIVLENPTSVTVPV